jgi:hypothetical protein
MGVPADVFGLFAVLSILRDQRNSRLFVNGLQSIATFFQSWRALR